MFTDAAEVGSAEREPSAGAVAPPRPSLNAFLSELLAEQQRLDTPAARFADRHSSFVARNLSRHSELIPLSAPSPGEQYAFEVDLDACSGCKACVASCHSLNGLDENETWRDVGLVLGGTAAHPYQQTVTTACHHCADPGCLNGCPVLAYEKDPVTGIVRHLDDQCIGCQYCVLKCPYDVPKFNQRLGIVRKCDMCHDRLADGEAPACVQACPTHAIRIVTVDVSATSALIDTSKFLRAAPDPDYTQPTTRYLSRRPQPANERAADAHTLRPQLPHWALIFLLVFTQLSVGLLGAALLVTHYGANMPGRAPLLLGGLSWIAAAIGLGASLAHLGQPLRAWRVFLNLRRSWLSREAVVFGGYFGLLSAAVGAIVIARAQPSFADLALHFSLAFAIAALGVGLIGVFCSGMIYVDTHRQFWRFRQSVGRMFGTVTIAGLIPVAPVAAAVALAIKLALECPTLHGPSHSARLQRRVFRTTVIVRFAFGGLAFVLLLGSMPLAGALFWLGGEFFERYLYFRAVDAPKMPGVAAP